MSPGMSGNAELHSAVSQIFNLQVIAATRPRRASADYKSATQQIGNLRYA